ncbi:MAG: DUF6179 domain-containing protein [Clostridium sp.]|jgi:hypothetical protein|nr:DUF6179 domain-containing protein [Clostridium sp.]
MFYEIEELLPMVVKLTDKYTSKESSSVPYEKAQMLMEAVLYCVREATGETEEETVGTRALRAREKPDAAILYQKGYEKILEKVYHAKAVYEEVIAGFSDYHCRNYKDTVLEGLPVFFVKYDPKFNPQSHILSLDYPLLTGNPPLVGIDLIAQYVEGIRTEKQFLDCFPESRVVSLLRKIQAEYKTLYLDNICYAVLLQALGCLIADRPVERLYLDAADLETIRSYFRDSRESLGEIAHQLTGLLRLLLKEMGLQTGYFEKAARDYAVRIYHGLWGAGAGTCFQTDEDGSWEA